MEGVLFTRSLIFRTILHVTAISQLRKQKPREARTPV